MKIIHKKEFEQCKRLVKDIEFLEKDILDVHTPENTIAYKRQQLSLYKLEFKNLSKKLTAAEFIQLSKE